MAKLKEAGRPPGAIGAKMGYGRDDKFGTFRCSQGFNKVVAELVANGLYKSKADVLHEAVEILARRKLDAGFIWLNKIQ